MELRVEPNQRDPVWSRTGVAGGRRTALVALGALAALALGRLPAQAAEQVTIAESEWAERCFDLGPGDTLHYSFRATRAVNFDLHYHSGDTTRYPLKKDDVAEGRGAYTAREAQKYCLSWVNPSLSATDVTIDVRTVKK